VAPEIKPNFIRGNISKLDPLGSFLEFLGTFLNWSKEKLTKVFTV